MAFTKHNNYPEIPIGAVEWPALYNDSIHKMDIGRTIKMIVGEVGGLIKGTPFYIQSDGKAYKALSTTTQLGLWQTTSTAQNIEGYGQVSGIIETGTWTAGVVVYVSATGTLTTVSPGATASPIAYAISTTELNLVRLTYQNMVSPDAFNAHTILKADVDNTPLALTVPEQTLVGRITAGNITALTKAQVLTLLGLSDALNYKGTIDASTNPNYPAADAGDYYKISVAGRIGGASGDIVEAGDAIICNLDGSPAGDQATVGANWNVVQTNIDLANPGSIGGTTPATGDFTVLKITTIKFGATQVTAGAAANELWKTLGHATLPDNVVLIGV